MKKSILSILFLAVVSLNVFAQEADSIQLEIDNIEAALNYETGVIELESGNATITIPEGFRFLDKEQGQYVLSDLWGNPFDDEILGLLVPADRGVLADDSWVFSISFDEMGYVEDDDAADIDYDDLLEEQQEEFRESNEARIEQGYGSIELIGWASDPFYDQDKKILHWAKELKFGDDETNTLNYDMRVLGRKGIFMLQAVANMSELPDVKNSIDKVLRSVEFKEGHRYSDFLPDVDNVAAWTIGGLVAGKLLAKAGILVLILKFWKILAIAVVGGIAAFKKFILKKEDDDDDVADEPVDDTKSIE